MIPHIAVLFQLSRDKLASQTDETRVVNSSIDLIGAVVLAVPTFLAPTQLGDSLLSAIQVDVGGSGKHFDALIASVAKRVPTPNLLPVVVSLWSRLLSGSDNVRRVQRLGGMQMVTYSFYRTTGSAEVLPLGSEDDPSCEQGFFTGPCQGSLCVVLGRLRSMQRSCAPQYHGKLNPASFLGHG